MEKESIQLEHKPNMNVDWTGENTWPSLNLPEKEEMQSYFIGGGGGRKKRKKKEDDDKVKASKDEQHAVSTFNAMYYFEYSIVASELIQVRTTLISPDLGKYANTLH